MSRRWHDEEPRPVRFARLREELILSWGAAVGQEAIAHDITRGRKNRDVQAVALKAALNWRRAVR